MESAWYFIASLCGGAFKWPLGTVLLCPPLHLFVERHLNGHWGLLSSVPLQHLRPLLASGPWVCIQSL